MLTRAESFSARFFFRAHATARPHSGECGYNTGMDPKTLHKARRHLSQSDAVLQPLIRGIGPWTPEMFLIFSLGRLDVLPVGDYGLRAGVQKHYALAELPKKDTLHELTQAWKPYRSIGTWYIWRSLGGVPQSD